MVVGIQVLQGGWHQALREVIEKREGLARLQITARFGLIVVLGFLLCPFGFLGFLLGNPALDGFEGLASEGAHAVWTWWCKEVRHLFILQFQQEQEASYTRKFWWVKTHKNRFILFLFQRWIICCCFFFFQLIKNFNCIKIKRRGSNFCFWFLGRFYQLMKAIKSLKWPSIFLLAEVKLDLIICSTADKIKIWQDSDQFQVSFLPPSIITQNGMRLFFFFFAALTQSRRRKRFILQIGLDSSDVLGRPMQY